MKGRLPCLEQQGLTLMELLFALALATIVMVAASGLAGLVAKTTRQVDERQGQSANSERVLNLIAAELKELVKIVDIQADLFAYESSYFGDESPQRRISTLRCIPDAVSGVTTLVHGSAEVVQASPSVSENRLKENPVVARTVYSRLTECGFQVGRRVLSTSGKAVYVQWSGVEGGVVSDAEMWLRVQMSNASGHQVPLYLGRVKPGV